MHCSVCLQFILIRTYVLKERYKRMEENKKNNPVVTIFDEESGKYYDITIDMELLESTELGDEEKALLEALLKEAEEQKEA